MAMRWRQPYDVIAGVIRDVAGSGYSVGLVEHDHGDDLRFWITPEWSSPGVDGGTPNDYIIIPFDEVEVVLDAATLSPGGTIKNYDGILEAVRRRTMAAIMYFKGR